MLLVRGRGHLRPTPTPLYACRTLQVRTLSTSPPIRAPRQSTVERGTAFEERSVQVLGRTMSMSLKRVGGKDDGGVDLIGWWWLPHVPDALGHGLSRVRTHHAKDTEETRTQSGEDALQRRGGSSKEREGHGRRRIRIFGQCKAEKKKLGPNYVRELEGVLFREAYRERTLALLSAQDGGGRILGDGRGAKEEEEDEGERPTLDPKIPSVALLVSQSPFTKAAMLRASSSPLPFLLLYLPELPPPSSVSLESETLVNAQSLGSAWCNAALIASYGLLKGKLELRWERLLLDSSQNAVISAGDPLAEEEEEGKMKEMNEVSRGRPAIWWNGKRLENWVPDSAWASTTVVDTPSNPERFT